MMMRLSAARDATAVKIVRDGKFNSLGFVTHKQVAMLAFIEDAKYLATMIAHGGITCVITAPQFVKDMPSDWGVAVAESPRRAFYEFHNWLARKTEFYWKTSPSEICRDAWIHSTACIADRDVSIGHRVTIEPHVVIQERVIIGDDVIVRAGTVIGSEGFEFARIDGAILPVAHAGGVLLHPRVEIQSNSCVDKAVFGGFTEIGEDSKIDNLVHIAHNVRIGRRCLLAACAMIAGSTTLGDDVWIGPGACISSEINVGDKASVTLGAIVTKHLVPGQRVSGNFAIDHDRFIAFLKTIR
jgi:UDP-3-O-[3-hydroxymyristoyl] glucosamine N-acyltransferase